MKKILVAAAVIAVAAAAIWVNTPAESRIWQEDGTVVAVDDKCVDVVTACGNIWSYYTDSDNTVYEGQHVTLTFDDNGTENVLDDEVIQCELLD